MTVGILGAGLAGLAASRRLSEANQPTVLFDKARGVGGRTSIRRILEGSFDLGAQYFTVRTEEFQRQVDLWADRGVVARWEAPIAVLEKDAEFPPTRHSTTPTRWVGVPGMNALARDLAPASTILQTRIVRVERRDDGWWFLTESDGQHGPFSAVISTLPSPQTVELLEASTLDRADLPDFDFQPCWAVLVSFESDLGLPFGGSFVHGSPLSWVANHRTKPGRPQTEAWILHAGGDWTTEHWELNPEKVCSILVEEFLTLVHAEGARVLGWNGHRWRYALAEKPAERGFLGDRASGFIFAGDWAHGGRVEGAYLSGVRAAESLLVR